MRRLLWLLLFSLGLAGVAIPLVYLVVASQLPTLRSELELESQLKAKVEDDRMGAGLELSEVSWRRPDIAKLPKDLVAVYLSQRGCPTFFQTEREQGSRWALRMFAGLVGSEPAGDGWCERLFSLRLAGRLGVEGTLSRTLAAHQIHSLLRKEQLVVYDLSSLWLDEGVVGVEAAARALFDQGLDQLGLSELAELALALPPHNYYSRLRDCQNPTLLRKHRDLVLSELARDSLVPPDRSANAQAQPMACARR